MITSEVGSIIQKFKSIIASDGGTLELLAIDGSTVRIRYNAGSDGCESCALTRDDLGAMLLEALQEQDPRIRTVNIT